MNKKFVRRIPFTDQDSITVLERFYNNLPKWPRCMSGLNQPSFQKPKDEAIKYPYIQLNKLRRAYICLDIDRPNAKLAHTKFGTPNPTIILINPDNGHAHIFYELKNPVPFTIKSRKKPQQYFLAVQRALTIKMEGDLTFTAYIVKNPFQSKERGGIWEAIFDDVKYDLKSLSSDLDLKSIKRNFPVKSKLRHLNVPILKGTRNVTVFEIVRKYSYSEIKNHEEYETFYGTMDEFSSSLNSRCCRPPLSGSVINYIVRRVCEWTWERRHELKNYSKRKHGIMSFGPIPADLDNSSREAEITMRKRAGAKYTHKKRRRKTEQKIVEAIEQLKTQNLKVTKAAVARLSGVSRENISKRYSHLFK